MNSDAYDKGYEAYIAGLDYHQNPYWCGYAIDAPEERWCDWYRGWDDAYLQFNRAG
jgi:hypothetical protein